MGSWGLEKNKRSTRRKLSSLCSISSGGPPFLLLHYLWVVCPSYLHLLPLILATDLSTAAPDKQKKTERERKVTKWRRGVPGWRATGCRHRTRKITLPLSTFRKGGERERGRLVHLALCYPPPLSPATAAATTRLFGQGSSTGVPTSFELEGTLPS